MYLFEKASELFSPTPKAELFAGESVLNDLVEKRVVEVHDGVAGLYSDFLNNFVETGMKAIVPTKTEKTTLQVGSIAQRQTTAAPELRTEVAKPSIDPNTQAYPAAPVTQPAAPEVVTQPVETSHLESATSLVQDAYANSEDPDQTGYLAALTEK